MSKFSALEFVADNCGLNVVDAIDKAYKQGKTDAINEFVKMFIEEGNKRKYLRHIWIEQTCNKLAAKLKEQSE